MDGKFIESVSVVTYKVFKTMISMSPLRGTPTAQLLTKTLYDVTAVVGFAGSISGTVSVQFKSGLAMKVTSNMLQFPVTTLNEDVSDAIGEVGNMIAGGIKTELSNRGIHFDIALPTVVMGVGHSIGHTPGADVLFFPFMIDGEPFIVSMCLKK